MGGRELSSAVEYIHESILFPYTALPRPTPFAQRGLRTCYDRQRGAASRGAASSVCGRAE